MLAITILFTLLCYSNLVFGLREGNGREDKRIRGSRKMWDQVIKFSSNLVHSLFSHAIRGKGLNFPSFLSSSPQTKHCVNVQL